jgi:hypothetical protein
VEVEALAVEAGVVEVEEPTVEAEVPAMEARTVEAEEPVAALLDGARGPGGGGWGDGGRGGAGLGVVEDGALLDRAPTGASKRRPEDWRWPGRRSSG